MFDRDNNDDYDDDFKEPKNLDKDDLDDEDDLENLDDHLDDEESSDDEDDLLQDEDALEDDPWEKQVRQNKQRRPRKDNLW